jgi:hypothetical protein
MTPTFSLAKCAKYWPSKKIQVPPHSTLDSFHKKFLSYIVLYAKKNYF